MREALLLSLAMLAAHVGVAHSKGQWCPGPSLTGYSRPQLIKHHWLMPRNDDESCQNDTCRNLRVPLNAKREGDITASALKENYTGLLIASVQFQSVGSNLSNDSAEYKRFQKLRRDVVHYLEHAIHIKTWLRIGIFEPFYTMPELLTLSPDCKGALVCLEGIQMRRNTMGSILHLCFVSVP